MSDELEHPTEEQRTVVELTAAARAFVVAGPGAGKTWTLLARARTLVERDEVEPSDLLVLSFTRAVVRELRRRDRLARRLATIFPQTFDSFATRLLSEHADDDAWMGRGFDARIVTATQLIRQRAAEQTLATFEHILVDEVQDLVGPRAELVRELMLRHQGGFTAFGDPAQAIYDHERGRSGPGLMDELQDGLAEHVVHLTGNHRAAGSLAATVAAVRAALLSPDTDAGVAAAADALLELDTVGGLDELAEELPTLRGERAVLCRDNATALLLSRGLHDVGVEHRVRRGTSDRPVAGWVAAVFNRSGRLTRDQYERRLAELSDTGFPALPALDEGWRLLTRLDPQQRGRAVRASEARSRIAVGRVPYELHDEASAEIVISSIHRAKGLEFDACVVVEWPRREEQDHALEARVLFVALSRARRDCLHADGSNGRRWWFRSGEAFDRFVKRGHEQWQTFGIELRGDDVHHVDPGGSVALDEDPAVVQSRLVTSVRPGDEITLDWKGELDFGRGARPVYAVEHEAGAIGVTGARFGDALKRRAKGAPKRILEVRVDDLETVAGSPETSEAAGLGPSGLWLRPRLVGLGEFNWRGT